MKTKPEKASTIYLRAAKKLCLRLDEKTVNSPSCCCYSLSLSTNRKRNPRTPREYLNLFRPTDNSTLWWGLKFDDNFEKTQEQRLLALLFCYQMALEDEKELSKLQNNSQP